MIGNNHVFGLLGQKDFADSTASTTNAKSVPALKAFRYRTANTVEPRHYMMISLLPYNYVEDASGTDAINLTIVRNEW